MNLNINKISKIIIKDGDKTVVSFKPEMFDLETMLDKTKVFTIRFRSEVNIDLNSDEELNPPKP